MHPQKESAAPDWRTLPPLILEGHAMSHTLLRLDLAALDGLDALARKAAAFELAEHLAAAEKQGLSAAYAVNGAAADLLLLHVRPTIDELQALDEHWRTMRIARVMRPLESHLSIIELSLHDASLELYSRLAGEGVEAHSDVWRAATVELLTRQRPMHRARLEPELPTSPWLCFYPMSRRRAAGDNWYTLPLEERARMMREHGASGRRWAGRVRQIISGSTGLGDWEWMVDLFADDAAHFKHIVHEMRFDLVSGRYSDFGSFLAARRKPLSELGAMLECH